MINRRNALRLAAGATSAVAGHQILSRGTFGAQAVPSAQGHRADHSGHIMPEGMVHERPANAGSRPPLEKFTLALPLLPTARPISAAGGQDVYLSRIRTLEATIFPGFRTKVYGYFGQWVPPVIRARSGRRAVVFQQNETKVPVSVHLHGGVNRAVFDGQMSTPVEPGHGFAYAYDNQQPAAALWLHDHTHHTDAEQVYRGMSSPYLISSREEDELCLPSGEFDVPLVLRDGDFGSDGRMIFTMDDVEHRSTVLVNGVPWPRMAVKRRKYRLRIINSSAMRFFVLGLSDGSALTQIGADASLLPTPVDVPVVVVSPGERADLVLDFTRWKTGSTVDLVNYIGPGPMEDVGQVMRFQIGANVPDASRVPDTLTRLAAVPVATVKRSFTLESSEPGVSPMFATINGQSFDMARIDTQVAFGSTEEWSITNTNKTIPHNFHCHLAHMRVVARSAGAVSATELGLKDTVQIFPGEMVRVRLTFDRHRGVYPYHCHMLDHGAMGMVAQLRVV